MSAATKEARREQAKSMPREGGRFVKKVDQAGEVPAAVIAAAAATATRTPARGALPKVGVPCEHGGCTSTATTAMEYQWRPMGEGERPRVRQGAFCLAHAESVKQSCHAVGARYRVVANGRDEVARLRTRP